MSDPAPSCLDTALELHRRRLPLTVCTGKKPNGKRWQNRGWSESGIRWAYDHDPDLNVGIVLGPGRCIDIEADSPEEEATRVELFAGVEQPRTPCYRSRRGGHWLYNFPPDFLPLDKAVVYVDGLGIRLGAGGKAAHSLLPPSTTDGFTREWIVPLTDCPLADLPPIVIQRILERKSEKKSRSKGGKPLGKWLDELVAACDEADEGGRSERDFALCAESARRGCDPDDVWERVADVGKFRARGRDYFDLTWANAAEAVADEPSLEGSRTLIEITTAEDEINAEVAELLANDPTLYVRGGSLAMIGDIDGEPTIVRVPDALIRDRVAAHVQFWAWARNRRVLRHPPDWNIKAIGNWLDWSHMRTLRAVVNVPTIRPDGSLLDLPGYDAATQLVYVASDCRPTVSSEPTHDDAMTALKLLDDVVCDFPFAKSVHRSACLANLLTLVGRHTYDGPAPLFAIDATTAGTGKGLLADAMFTIACGKPAFRWANPSSDDEARKRITSLAISGRPAVLIDNIAGVFGSPAMDSALTATSWGDRLLGVNKDVQLPLKIVWTLTANNLIVGGDTGRRVCPIRLESKDEHPEERTGFKHPELLAYVSGHRAELLGACLTILRGWYAAGRPRQSLSAWGSFEAWSGVIRQAIVWLGLPDPADAREAFRTVADRDAATLRELLDGISTLDPEGKGLKAAEIVDRASEVTGLKTALAELCGEKMTAKTVANKLASIRGRILGGRCVDAHTLRGGYQGWLVRSADIAV